MKLQMVQYLSNTISTDHASASIAHENLTENMKSNQL